MYYRHLEGNSAAHIKSSIQQVIVSEGRLYLGTWQGFSCVNLMDLDNEDYNYAVVTSRITAKTTGEEKGNVLFNF